MGKLSDEARARIQNYLVDGNSIRASVRLKNLITD